jgi:hypothetical protein
MSLKSLIYQNISQSFNICLHRSSENTSIEYIKITLESLGHNGHYGPIILPTARSRPGKYSVNSELGAFAALTNRIRSFDSFRLSVQR